MSRTTSSTATGRGWAYAVQNLLKAARDVSSKLLRDCARRFVQENPSEKFLPASLQEGHSGHDHPTVETFVGIVQFILKKRCLDQGALEVFQQRSHSDQPCAFGTALCLPAKHPWVQKVSEPARKDGSGARKRKFRKGSGFFESKVVKLRHASRVVLKQVIVFELLCAHYYHQRSALPSAGRHSLRGSTQAALQSDDDGDDGSGQDRRVEEEAEALVAKYQDTLAQCTGRHQPHLSAALQIM